MAKTIYRDYEPCLTGFGVPPTTQQQLKRQLSEAPISIFRPVHPLALNVLCPLYDEWLGSAAGEAFCRDAIGLARIPRPKQAVTLDASDDYMSAW